MDTINLLMATASSIQEIANFLRLKETDGELRIFYAILPVYCSIIRDHSNRLTKAGVRMDDSFIMRILVIFQSLTECKTNPESSPCPSQLCAALHALNQRWGLVRQSKDGIELQFSKSFVNSKSSQEERNAVIESLEVWDYDFRVKYPDDLSEWSASESDPKSKISEPPYAVANAAQSVFKALMACKGCECIDSHDFRAELCLGTYRKANSKNHSDEEHSFDMFLQMQQEWHETCIHTMKETTIQWAVDTEASRSQLREKKVKVKPMKVKKLCDPIRKIKTMKSYRLELKVMKGQLFKLQSEKSHCLIDKTKRPITLEQLLKDGSRSFTERTRRILSVLLSYTVLYLHDTSWLQSTWDSSKIVFFRNNSSAIPLRPFLQTPLSSLDSSYSGYDLSENDFDPDDVDPDDLIQHQCPTLVSFARILLEYFVTSFEILARKYNVDLGDELFSFSKHINTELVFQACRSEIPENFQYAVERCLDPITWEDEDGNKLDLQSMRTKIYQEVVRPLENELIQAFSSISIDNLDQFAHSLDFGSWGQVIIKPATTEDYSQSANASKDAYSHMQMPSPTYSPQSIPPSSYFEPYQAVSGSDNLVVAQHPSYLTDKMTGSDINYNVSKFFDDETVSEAHSHTAQLSYTSWKSRFRAVYDKFIPPYLERQPSSSVKIAVLDTGIDQNHPDVEACLENIKGKYNWLNENLKTSVHDRNGHGTFTAGLLLDYAPDAHLYIAKIAENAPSSPRIIAKAIKFVVEEWGVDIISMSFGFPTCKIDDYDELEDAIRIAYSNNVLIFAAASNSGGKLGRAYPARDQNVICIHSTDTNGNRSPFSPTAVAHDINLATVGEAVESAWPVHLCDDNSTFSKYKSGTSFATPIAAGIAAFLLQYTRLHIPDKANAPKLQRRMKALLQKVAEKGHGWKPRDGYYFLDLSLYNDNLFGKDKDFIDRTIRDILCS
ncbi:Subtilisin BL [Cladobotryum mycophilum]|uniref:Subtilisin BL n=1 Tax=Cladobotryum mycophilum TaxID=491253 RepID=A0ABR0SIV6_9HYPO